MGVEGGYPTPVPPAFLSHLRERGEKSKNLVIGNVLFFFFKKLGVRSIETLSLSVLMCSRKILALLKGQETIANSSNKYILITHYVPGTVLAGYNGEQAVRKGKNWPSWRLHSSVEGKQ